MHSILNFCIRKGQKYQIVSKVFVDLPAQFQLKIEYVKATNTVMPVYVHTKPGLVVVVVVVYSYVCVYYIHIE